MASSSVRPSNGSSGGKRAAHVVLRALSALNVAQIALVWLSPRYHEFVLSSAPGALLFVWLCLSALAFPAFVLREMWRLGRSGERGPEFRRERLALITDGACILAFLAAWVAAPPVGYLW